MRPRLANLVLPVVSLLLAGCFAQHTTFRPTAEQEKVLKEAPLPYSVAVRHWQRPSASNPVAFAMMATNLMTASGAFSKVSYDSAGTMAADLVAESTDENCADAVIPVFTLLTLGLFPTIWHEEQCSGVVFRSAENGGDSIVVRVQQSGAAVLGWLALPLVLLPGWSGDGMDMSAAVQRRFRLAVVERRQDLARLAGR